MQKEAMIKKLAAVKALAETAWAAKRKPPAGCIKT